MTVHDALLTLWSNVKPGRLDATEAKRLWMLLQNFIEKNNGRDLDAKPFDVRGGAKDLDRIRPQPTIFERLLGEPVP